ncbi:hypothetical protein [Caudoviricetes sp.]|nr:hypothetical protein [Caudoviricetes sp.]
MSMWPPSLQNATPWLAVSLLKPITKGRIMTVWPFPGPSGPIPWTAQQERQYQAQQRNQLPEAPL